MYLYITSDGKIKTALKRHIDDKKKHLLKPVMHDKNTDMPFCVKLKVLNACFLCSIMYR